MRLKKYLRFLMLLIFLIIATILPFPIRFFKKDNQPSYEIEQVDKKEEDETSKEEDQAFS